MVTLSNRLFYLTMLTLSASVVIGVVAAQTAYGTLYASAFALAGASFLSCIASLVLEVREDRARDRRLDAYIDEASALTRDPDETQPISAVEMAFLLRDAANDRVVPAPENDPWFDPASLASVRGGRHRLAD